MLFLPMQLLRELPEMENQLRVKQSSQAKVYSTDLLSLSIIGVLRQYHLYALVSHELAIQVFEGSVHSCACHDAIDDDNSRMKMNMTEIEIM